MGYALGIDLGTTFSAAAIHRGDRVEIVQLGSHGAAIPSVVVLRSDNTVLTGEAAERRAATEPERVAREFKRRLGDSTPLILGGAPQSVEAVTARLLRSVVDQVTQLEGSAPDHITLTHPANWGEFKLDLLRQAIRMANLPEASLVTEPEAAARHYASQARVPDGATVAVYDVTDAYLEEVTGGGTAVLHQGAAVLLETVDEVIEVKGGSPVTYTVAIVPHHGPILPTIVDGAPVPLEDGEAVSIRWTGMEPTGELSAILNLMRATNVDDARAALSDFETGGQNWMIGDASGEILWTSHVRMPRRAEAALAWDPQAFEGNLPCFVLPGDGSADFIYRAPKNQPKADVPAE